MARNVRVLILALLCVLAVTLAAATLTNPLTDAPGTGGGASPVENEGFDRPANERNSSQSNTSLHRDKSGNGLLQIGFGCAPFLMTPEFAVGALATIALLVFYLRRRETLSYALGIVIPIVLFMAPFWLAMTDCGGVRSIGGGGIPGGVGNVSASPDTGGTASETTQQLLSPLVLLGLLLVVTVVLAYLTIRASGDDTIESEEQMPEQDEPSDDEAALEALGAVAGQAADRIEAPADVDNEVYRAWREMTGHLNVDNPEASTPAEFEDAARAAGMSRDHVERLTALFRDVRYGGQSPTEDREQEAVDALRAIEETYREGEE